MQQWKIRGGGPGQLVLPLLLQPPGAWPSAAPCGMLHPPLDALLLLGVSEKTGACPPSEPKFYAKAIVSDCCKEFNNFVQEVVSIEGLSRSWRFLYFPSLELRDDLLRLCVTVQSLATYGMQDVIRA